MKRNNLLLSAAERAKQFGISQEQFEAQTRKQVDEYFRKKYPGMLGPELKPHEKLELAKQISPQSDVYHHSHKDPDWPPFPLPDIYDADDPHLARDAFGAIRWLRLSNSYRDNSASPLFGEQYKAAIEVALDIRLEFPELREVPLAKNLDCPTEQDFINLEQWFLDAYTFEQAEIARWSTKEKPLNASDEKPLEGESPVRIETAIGELQISHSRVKQAARDKEIYSEQPGGKPNSPYLVYKSQVQKKFSPHGPK